VDHLALDARLADTVYARLGAAGTLTPPDGTPVAVQAIVDEETTLRGELGEVIDPRPSVTLDRRVVGDRPKGLLTVGDRSWTLDRVIDGGDRYEVRVYLRPEASA
jgi:hypothetical protein